MSKKLKDLGEHDKEQSNLYKAIHDSPALNGIACPECGEELYDSRPKLTLMSLPPKKNVSCSKCDYVGYRIA